MKTGIHIGPKESKKKVKHIISLLEAFNKYETSNKVAIKALETYTEVAKVENVSISHCNISGTDTGLDAQ